MYAFRVYFLMTIYRFRCVFWNPRSRMGTKLKLELPPPPPPGPVLFTKSEIETITLIRQSHTYG